MDDLIYECSVSPGACVKNKRPERFCSATDRNFYKNKNFCHGDYPVQNLLQWVYTATAEAENALEKIKHVNDEIQELKKNQHHKIQKLEKNHEHKILELERKQDHKMQELKKNLDHKIQDLEKLEDDRMLLVLKSLLRFRDHLKVPEGSRPSGTNTKSFENGKVYLGSTDRRLHTRQLKLLRDVTVKSLIDSSNSQILRQVCQFESDVSEKNASHHLLYDTKSRDMTSIPSLSCPGFTTEALHGAENDQITVACQDALLYDSVSESNVIFRPLTPPGFTNCSDLIRGRRSHPPAMYKHSDQTSSDFAKVKSRSRLDPSEAVGFNRSVLISSKGQSSEVSASKQSKSRNFKLRNSQEVTEISSRCRGDGFYASDTFTHSKKFSNNNYESLVERQKPPVRKNFGLFHKLKQKFARKKQKPSCKAFEKIYENDRRVNVALETGEVTSVEPKLKNRRGLVNGVSTERPRSPYLELDSAGDNCPSLGHANLPEIALNLRSCPNKAHRCSKSDSHVQVRLPFPHPGPVQNPVGTLDERISRDDATSFHIIKSRSQEVYSLPFVSNRLFDLRVSEASSGSTSSLNMDNDNSHEDDNNGNDIPTAGLIQFSHAPAWKEQDHLSLKDFENIWTYASQKR